MLASPASLLPVAVLSSILTGALAAQIGPPRLLTDLDARPPLEARSSRPTEWTPFADRLYFVADGTAVGRELFVTDGTAPGTTPALDLTPGPRGAAAECEVVGNHLFLSVDSGPAAGLWMIDASPAEPPVQLLELGNGAYERAPRQLTVVGDRLFFTAADALHGEELWISDGTPAGTALLADLQPGAAGSDPGEMQALGDRLLFVADTPGLGREPWASDGTSDGTELLVDSVPGPADAFGVAFVPGDLRGRCLFFVDRTLFATDGTATGTEILHQGAYSTFAPEQATEFGGALYFAAATSPRAHGLWRSDGTAAGTSQVYASVSEPIGIAGVVGSRLVFGTRRLFATDGTAAGTTPILGDQCAYPSSGTVLGGQLVFMARNGSPAVFTTDGHTVTRLQDGFTAVEPLSAVLGGRLFFGAEHVGGDGDEPWVTDGTAAGTALFTDLGVWPAGASRSSDPRALIRHAVAPQGAGLAFLANTTDIEALWLSDGSAPGTRSGPLCPGDGPFAQLDAPLRSRAGKLFVLSRDPQSSRRLVLHADDGTGPVLVGGAPAGAGRLPWRAHRDGVALLDASDVVLTDGSAAGTSRTALGPVGTTPQPTWWAAAGSAVLVQATADDRGQLYRIEDGGVSTVADLDGFIADSMVADGFVFLSYEDPGDGSNPRQFAPWVTDGTAAGTRLLYSILPGGGSAPRPLCRTPGGIAFHAWDGADSLWLTDGTTAGTVKLPDLFGGGRFPADGRGLLVGDRLVVTVEDPAFGRELKTLGPGGIELLDLYPGPASSNARLFASVGDELWFVADLPGTGRTLLRTRGTSASTELIASLDSEPTFLTLSDGRVWLDLDDGIHGREPWWLDPGAVIETIGHACGDGLQLPQLAATDPVIDQTWTFRGWGGSPGAPGLLVLGLPEDRPRRLGDWCWTWLDLGTTVPIHTITDSGTPWRRSIDIPNDPALLGNRLVVESWHSEPGGPADFGSSATLLAVFGRS